MPLGKDGNIEFAYSGEPMHLALPHEIQELRKELRHMERILTTLEGQARARFPADAMKPQFSALFNWQLSAMESFVSMSLIAFDDKFTKVMVRDYVRRFKLFL